LTDSWNVRGVSILIDGGVGSGWDYRLTEMKKRAIARKSYVFLDESGKPEVFSRKGTNLVQAGTASKHLVISAVRTNNHLAVQQAVTGFRLKLLKDESLVETFSPAYSLNAFHAQTDYPVVRKLFFEWIRDCPLDLKISVIVAEKLKAYPQLQRDASLKARERLNLVVDTLRIAYAKGHEIRPKTTVSYYHNPHYTHGGLQIADYVAHAVFQVFEKGDRRWYEIIKDRIGYIQDIFNKKSYSRGSPL
jgi:hypothetical protein